MFSEVTGNSQVSAIFAALNTPLRFLIIAVFMIFAIKFSITAVINFVQMMSKESPQEKQTYKQAAISALYGLAVSVVGFLVVQLLLSIFGVGGLFG